MERQLVNYAEAARITTMPKATLAWLVHLKKIPHLRLGPRTVRFDVAELQTWIESKQVQSESLTNDVSNNE